MSPNTDLILPDKPRYDHAEFLASAAKVTQCPPDLGWEVTFAGRSNAGKSSAINSLTRNLKLARTSKTPGRTQLLNFFSLTEQQRLVDLPGYGFAKVPIAMKKAWTEQVEAYLQQRQSLQGIILLMDIRHPLQPFDEQLVSWAIDAGMPCHILLTKADKFKRGAQEASKLKVEKELAPRGGVITVQTFSSLKHQGHESLIQKLDEWLTQDLTAR